MMTPDVCTEPCGDGLNAGFYGCDDGNTRDGDGCSAKCTLEPGFQCLEGSPYTKDVC